MLCGLAARGHEIVACARHVDLNGKPPFELVETGLAARRESIEPIAYAVKVARLFSRMGGERRFEIVHWLFPQGQQEVLGGPRRVPFIVGPHALAWPGRAVIRKPGDVVRATATPLFRVLHRRALGRAAALLVATPNAATNFPRAFRSKVRVLPFGIDEAQIVPTDLPPTPTIGFVGRLELVKGVLNLLDAFARVKEEIPDATLLIAGEGPARGVLEETCARLRLNGSVRLLGQVPHSKIPEVLSACSVVCLPSLGEPYGMAVLEAMAGGRAVVAPNCAGPQFLLAHESGDQLVGDNEAHSLAPALINLLADKDRLASIGRTNRARVESMFTLDRVLKDLESIYEDAM
jgi:glycosyltransferase involved in cell wall biosynthesis